MQGCIVLTHSAALYVGRNLWLELKNRFTALEEHDDMDSLNKNMTEMIQQSALSIAKQTKKQKNPKISSPTRALMKKRREMIENKTPETT